MAPAPPDDARRRPRRPPFDLGRRAVDRFVGAAAAAIPAGAVVLDLGAGESRYRDRFPGKRYFAVDLALGDARWDYRGLDCLADLHRLPFRDRSADAVVSTQTLEHLRDPRAFFREVARVLRPGGALFLTAPQSFREHQAPHDYWRFTRYSLRMLAEEAGFEGIGVDALGGFFAFLGDRMPAVHRYLFPKRRALPWRILAFPLVLVSKPLFAWILPRVCGWLDPLDTKRTWVNGYGLRARVPGPGGGDR